MSNARETTAIGYLALEESPSHGMTGGYLTVSQTGRPLEFHCTTPIRPTRAQELLFGPTLRPYLAGEVLGGALLSAAKITPLVLLVQDVDLIDLGEGVLVALLHEEGVSSRRDWIANKIDGVSFFTPKLEERLSRSVCDTLEILSAHIDLDEPFDRIREAIREAQRIGTASPPANDAA